MNLADIFFKIFFAGSCVWRPNQTHVLGLEVIGDSRDLDLGTTSDAKVLGLACLPDLWCLGLATLA